MPPTRPPPLGSRDPAGAVPAAVAHPLLPAPAAPRLRCTAAQRTHAAHPFAGWQCNSQSRSARRGSSCCVCPVNPTTRRHDASAPAAAPACSRHAWHAHSREGAGAARQGRGRWSQRCAHHMPRGGAPALYSTGGRPGVTRSSGSCPCSPFPPTAPCQSARPLPGTARRCNGGREGVWWGGLRHEGGGSIGGGEEGVRHGRWGNPNTHLLMVGPRQ